MTWVIGIDPGLAGALVVTNGQKAVFEKMPVLVSGKDKEIDWREIREILERFGKVGKTLPFPHVFLERAVSFGMGTKSAFNYGRGFAAIEIVLQDNDYPYTLVEPAKWTKVMHAGIAKDLKPKAKSQIAIKRLFPKLAKLCTFDKNGKPHDGAIDALLIAGYGLRQPYGGDSSRYAIEDF
jgi:hypothetical protein